ncbi:hypothetical protein AGMMS4952_23300 [Spirochaetia bacterium]|nr:hypothetical protein AGMMS4952_23300 [Spirochaetia bacterium]
MAVTKTGYTISGSPKTVAVFYNAASGPTEVTFSSLVADGSATTATTTKLTLTFDKDITGLTAGDIALTSVTTGATKGALTTTATAGVYELAVSGITAGGYAAVAVPQERGIPL